GPVDLVEPEVVDAEHGEALVGGGLVDGPMAPDLGEVAHPTQEPVGDAGRAPGPAGDLVGAGGIDVDAEDARGADDDGLELVGVVVVEAGDQAEAVTQRAGDHPRAGGGPDEGEPGKVEADRAR